MSLPFPNRSKTKTIITDGTMGRIMPGKITASQLAKSLGAKSLADVSKKTGISPQTLNNWHKNRPKLFKILIIGCKNYEASICSAEN